MMVWFARLLGVAVIVSATSRLIADPGFEFMPRDGGEYSVRVNGLPVAERFGLRLIRPGWKGTYDNQIKAAAAGIQPNGVRYQATIGSYGRYDIEIKKETPLRITAAYRIDLTRPLPLGAAYISVFIPATAAVQQGWFATPAAYAVPFPISIQKHPVYSESVNFFAWTDGLGRAIKLTFPAPTAVDLVDQRRWGKTYFELLIKIRPVSNPGKTNFTMTLETSDDPVRPFVDRFGQCAVLNWPGKVLSDEDLRRDAARESPALIEDRPPGRDNFGGWAGTKDKFHLRATGFFTTQKVNGRWWLVDPAGNVFFSLGTFFVYCDTYTDPAGRESLFEWLPDRQGPWRPVWFPYGGRECISFYKANLMRKYGREWGKLWYINSRNRWLDWGFNTASAFGNRLHGIPGANGPYPLIDQCAPMIPGAAPDVFDPDLPKKLEELCRKQLTPIKSDPYFLGYFFGNEQPFQKIPEAVLQLDAKFAAKRRLVEFLKGRYPSVPQFNAAWNLKAKDFAELTNLKFSAKTAPAKKDMNDFLALYCETYGRLLRETVKRYDPNHLLIGFRWMANTAGNPIIAEHLGRYMDVISVNYYPAKNINTDFLAAVSRNAGDKPILLSEFSCGSSERGHTGGVQNVVNQQERGRFYRRYLESATATTFIVGCHWYEYVDQAVTGRYYGGAKAERCNCGLVDITDRPYPDFVEAVRATNRQIYDKLNSQTQPAPTSQPAP